MNNFTSKNLLSVLDRMTTPYYDKLAQRIAINDVPFMGKFVLASTCAYDNKLDENYYPIVKTGELTTILTISDFATNPFISGIGQTMRNGNNCNFKWNEEIARNMLVCYFDDTPEIISPCKTNNDDISNFVKIPIIKELAFNDYLKSIEKTVESYKTKLLVFNDLSYYADSKKEVIEITRKLEDFAEIHEIAVLAFWQINEDQDSCSEIIKSVFANYGHNVCYLHLSYDNIGSGMHLIFEFGGIYEPKEQFYSIDENDNLIIDSEFTKFLLLRNFCVCATSGVPVRSAYLQNQLFGYYSFNRTLHTSKCHLSQAKKMNIIESFGNGSRTRYLYVPDCEKKL